MNRHDYLEHPFTAPEEADFLRRMWALQGRIPDTELRRRYREAMLDYAIHEARQENPDGPLVLAAVRRKLIEHRLPAL